MTSELNYGLSFQRLSKEQRESFSPSRVPVLFRFDSGQRVWKWTYPGSRMVNPEDNTISEYWIPWDSIQVGSIVTPGFKKFRMQYQNRGSDAGKQRDAARTLFAVTEQFNPMTTLLVAEFILPVWGLIGKCGGKRKFEDDDHPGEQDNVFFIGGGYQVVIPGLTTGHIKKL